MSEVPVLRDALLDTAERYVRRRRRSRRALAPLLVAACAFIVLLAVFRDGDTPEEIVATPGPTVVATPAPTVTLAAAQETLAATYAVFRRPAEPSDRVPKRFRMAPRKIEIDWARARRIASADRVAAYAVPAIVSGRVGLCTFTRVSAAAGGGGCGSFVPAEVLSKPRWSRTSATAAPVFTLLLPDGVSRVEVHFKDGTSLTRPVQENGFLYQGRRVERLSWRDATGARHSTKSA